MQAKGADESNPVKDDSLGFFTGLAPVKETEDHIIVKKIPHLVPGLEVPQFDITTSPTNIYVLRKFHKSGDGSRGEHSCYMPNFPYLDYSTRIQLPQYIYRTTHCGSGGYVSKGHFKSRAMVNGTGATDFFAFSNRQMRNMIEQHVNGTHFNEDHWISFTDSMATVISRALKSEQMGMQNVQIHIIDTHRIEKPALIVWAYAAMKAYKACETYHPSRYKLLAGAAYPEFLVWDEIEAVGSYVALRDLHNPGPQNGFKFAQGLLDLMPRLRFQSEKKTGKHSWQTLKPRQIQDRFYGLEDEIRLAKELGRCKVGLEPKVKDLRAPISCHNINDYFMMVRHVDPAFQLPMLVGFLSMCTRTFYQDGMIDELGKAASYIPSPGPTFYDTTLRTPAKCDVYYFQSIYGKVCGRLGIQVVCGWERAWRNVICVSDKEGIKLRRSEEEWTFTISQRLKRKLEAMQSYPKPVQKEEELFFIGDGAMAVDGGKSTKRTCIRDEKVTGDTEMLEPSRRPETTSKITAATCKSSGKWETNPQMITVSAT